MILDTVELHNIAEAREIKGLPGLLLQRVPEDVRLCLNPRAQERMLSPAGAEIRFVCDDDEAKVTVSCPDGAAEVIPFWGRFQGRERYTIRKEPVTLELTYPERLSELDPRMTEGMPFPPRVWRLMLRGDGLHFHEAEARGMCPPAPDQLPELRYLAYGTSITHGAAATATHLTYVSQTAWRLGADLINLGVGGSAYCEPELADYIASRDDWHIATLALSVNMIGGGFSVEEFSERTSYVVNTVAGAHPDRPVACITLYPHFGDWSADEELKAKSVAFRQALREVVASSGRPNVHLIEGSDILADIGGLTVDLIHPGDHGMIQMGENLAWRLRGMLGRE